MKRSLCPLLLSLLLLQEATAFLTVQKRDRHVAFGTHSTAAAPNQPASSNNHQHDLHHPRHVPKFMAASHAGVNPLAMAQEQGFTPWIDADDSVDLSYSTIIMACALSMALGFGLGYGT